jgi:uncharacterized protein with von Willebrand factor type A (vWA) domain
MLSFVPTFESSQKEPQDIEIAVNDKPEADTITELEEKNFFIFIVDRSGSMSGSKMETTKQALTLFLQSLPPDSFFEIISFGSNFKGLTGSG